MAKLHIIYVPGLGDDRTFGQDIAIQFWRLFGVSPHYHAVSWSHGEWQPKLAALLNEIDGYLQAGENVGLVGFSAGATAVLNAFGVRREKLSGIVCISGKIQDPAGVSSRIRTHNPAFMQSLQQVQDTLQTLGLADKSRIRTVYPQRDQVVSLSDATIDAVTVWRTPGKSHMASIIWNLLPGSLKIIRFLRAQAKTVKY